MISDNPFALWVYLSQTPLLWLTVTLLVYAATDALSHAPGPIACRVECWDRLVAAKSKLVCGRRRVSWMADATRTLRLYACWCAEQALALIPPDQVDPRSEGS